MGSWSYCTCGRGMERPNFKEAMLRKQFCGHCGRARDVIDEDEITMALDDLEERLVHLENKCA